MFEVVVLAVASVEVLFKTVAMEIFKRICAPAIAKIHIALIMVFILANMILYVWSILLNLDFRREGATSINEPH